MLLTVKVAVPGKLHKAGDIGRVQTDLAPSQAKVPVDDVVEEGRQRVCQLLAKEVAVAVKLGDLIGGKGVA